MEIIEAIVAFNLRSFCRLKVKTPTGHEWTLELAAAADYAAAGPLTDFTQAASCWLLHYWRKFLKGYHETQDLEILTIFSQSQFREEMRTDKSPRFF